MRIPADSCTGTVLPRARNEAVLSEAAGAARNRSKTRPCAELTDAAPVRGELPDLPLRRASSLNRYPAERAHHSGTSHSRLHLDIEPLWP